MRLSPLRWVAVAALAAGCAPHQAPPKAPTTPIAQGALQVTPVSDEAFAFAVQKLLRDGKATPERTSLLAGVVARQLAHAADRFVAGHNDRGMAAISGALYLTRASDFRPEMLGTDDAALDRASAVVAGQGDEGRAMALYSLRLTTTTAGSRQRKEVEDHLAALKSWLDATQKGGPIEQVGVGSRWQVARALLDPSRQAHAAARDATLQWIGRAVDYQEHEHPNERLKREDAFEAYRALRSGAETLAALYVREGDAAGALEELDRSAAKRIVPPQLHDALEDAAAGGDGSAWRELLGYWLASGHSGKGEHDDPDLAIDPELLRAAVWGTCVEGYRRDPTAKDVDLTLGALLARFGLPEVTPLVLADNVVTHPEPAGLEAALDLTLRVLEQEEEAEDLPSARRVFRAAAPLFDVAKRADMRGSPQAHGAELRLRMGMLEARAGNLSEARPLVEGAIATAPSADGYLTLTAIDRQSKRLSEAIGDVEKAMTTASARQSQTISGELHLLAFDLHKQAASTDKARTALTAALRYALAARSQARAPGEKARAERLLARTLDAFGDLVGAARATERAFVAAGNDKRQLAATVIDDAARAFLHSDVKHARAAATRALQGELSDDDVVYVALWLSLLEKQTKVKSDGTASRALGSIGAEAGWAGKLAAWGQGKSKDADLAAGARTGGQKTEAAFYVALAKRIAGNASGAETDLRKVADAATIDLVEVQLARALLGGGDAKAFGPVPSGMTIP